MKDIPHMILIMAFWNWLPASQMGSGLKPLGYPKNRSSTRKRGSKMDRWSNMKLHWSLTSILNQWRCPSHQATQIIQSSTISDLKQPWLRPFMALCRVLSLKNHMTCRGIQAAELGIHRLKFAWNSKKFSSVSRKSDSLSPWFLGWGAEKLSMKCLQKKCYKSL